MKKQKKSLLLNLPIFVACVFLCFSIFRKTNLPGIDLIDGMVGFLCIIYVGYYFWRLLKYVLLPRKA